MNTTNTPMIIDETVNNFCKIMVGDTTPYFVSLLPEQGCIQDECYENVKQKVINCGGQRQLGWRIQVCPDPYPKFMIEAVHHAIWISNTGKKIDITPQPMSASKIVFLPDDKTELKDYRIGAKYHALIDCPLVDEYVMLCNMESRNYISKTKLDDTPDIPKELTHRQILLLDEIMWKHGHI